MPADELKQRCTRIKELADELMRWPSPCVVRDLCREAEAGCSADPSCAIWFFAVRNAGWDLLRPGGWIAREELPVAIEKLDAVVTAQQMLDASVA